jgi:hypothetical protein
VPTGLRRQHQGKGRIARDVDTGNRVHLDGHAQSHEILLNIRQMHLRHPGVGDVVWIMPRRKEDDVDPHIIAGTDMLLRQNFRRHGNADQPALIDGIGPVFGAGAPFDFGKDGQARNARNQIDLPARSSRGGL